MKASRKAHDKINSKGDTRHIGGERIARIDKRRGAAEMEENGIETAYEESYELAERKLMRIIMETEVMAYGMEAIYQAGQSDDCVSAECLWQLRDELREFQRNYLGKIKAKKGME